MTYKVTPRTEALVRELSQLAKEIENGLLARASWDARQEWDALRLQWPTADELSSGATTVSDDALGFMVEKVRRFRSILRAARFREMSRETLASLSA